MHAQAVVCGCRDRRTHQVGAASEGEGDVDEHAEVRDEDDPGVV